MNKRYIIIGVVIVLIGVAVFSYYPSTKPVSTNTADMSQMNTYPQESNVGTPTTTTTTQTPSVVTPTTNTTTPVPVNTSAVAPKTYSVSIQGFAFSPNTIEIKAGDTVIWTNKDGVPHTITSDSGTELSSTNLSENDTYSHTFTKAGTFNYHCSIHPGMKASIIVR